MADAISPASNLKASKTAPKTRRSTPRTRTGCMTCRKRRIKCDETRPACLKCVAAKWQCDGYPTSPPTTTPARPPLHITSYALPFQVAGSQKDRQMLHYFCVRGSHDISGFVGTKFWTRTVLRESQDNHIVRATLVALSSLQLEYTTTAATSDYPSRGWAYAATPETIMQYERAVRLLRKHLAFAAANTKIPKTNVLKTAVICSVLFYAVETALGNSHAAVSHINNGLRMMASCRESLAARSNNADSDLPDLVMILERLDLQACLYDNKRTLTPPLLSGYEDKAAWTMQQDVFSRLEDANSALVKIQLSLVRFLIMFKQCNFELPESIPPFALQQRDRLVGQFATWMDKFIKLKSTIDVANDLTMVCAIATVLVQFHMYRMLLSSTTPFEADMFKKSPNRTANSILDAVSQILEHLGGQNGDSNHRRSFSLETSVVAPLFMLAMKCSDESVCSRALQLLASLNRREGPYDAQKMAYIIATLQDQRRKTTTFESAGKWIPLENLLQVTSEEISGGMDSLLHYI